MSLARQPGDSPTSHHSLCPAPPSDGNCVDHLIGREDLVNGDLLLKQVIGEVHLGSSVSTIDLHQTGILRAYSAF